jgi:hypothetical protein
MGHARSKPIAPSHRGDDRPLTATILNGTLLPPGDWEHKAVSTGKVGGRCLCGAIEFQYGGTPNWTLHCHCESCRRATSSPMTTWISVPRSAFGFIKGAPRHFASSPGVIRGFCENCGSPLTYECARAPDEVHVYAASLLAAANVVPTRHVFVAEQLPWFEVLDELPRYATTSSGGAPPLRIGRRK